MFAGKDNKTDWVHGAFKSLFCFQIAEIWPPLKPPKTAEYFI